MSAGDWVVPKPHSFHKVTLAEQGIGSVVVTSTSSRPMWIIDKQPSPIVVLVKSANGKHERSDTDSDQYKRSVALYAAAVEHRNKLNVEKFLRYPPKTPGEFFTVKAMYLLHEVKWYYKTLGAALEDAGDNCKPVSITGPSGVTVTDFMSMTVEQVRFILDGNATPMSDGAL